MFESNCYLLESQNGGLPVKHSYINTPNKYQSNILVCPLLHIIYGAKYAVLPQNECESAAYFDNPKSVIQACPSLSKTIFPAFKSL